MLSTTTKACLEPSVGLVGILCSCPADPHVSPLKAKAGFPFRLKSIMEQAGYTVKVRRYTTTAKLGPLTREFSYCVLEGMDFVHPGDTSSTQLRPETSSTSAQHVSELGVHTKSAEFVRPSRMWAPYEEKRTVWLLAALVDFLVYTALFVTTVAEFRELAVPAQVGIDLYLNMYFLMMLVQFPASLIVGTLLHIDGGPSFARLSAVRPKMLLNIFVNSCSAPHPLSQACTSCSSPSSAALP